jgi:beta-N-acetylhexosaminidase
MSASVTRRHLITGTAASAAAVTGAALLPSSAWSAMPEDAVTGWVTSTMARMSRDQLIGQLLIQYAYGATATTADTRNVPLFGVDTAAAAVEKYHLGGMIYFAWSDNVRNPEQIAALSNGLQAAAPTVTGGRSIPLLIATDQEMGVVTRVGPPATQFPGSMALGATRDPALARTAAAITGKELRAMGITVNFAPDSDVNVNPLNPVIGVRSFGSRPDLVADMVSAQVTGYQTDGRVASATKHFPGHGDTGTDSHYGLPVITHTREEWERIDAPPFRAAIAAGVDMVMSAHLVMTAFDASGDSATLSKPILTGLLRGELGYSGVIVTDSLEMAGVREKYGDDEVAVRALEAGVDQLLMTPDVPKAWAAINAAIDSGRLTMDQIRAKVRRILTMKYRRGMIESPQVDIGAIPSVVGTASHLDTAATLTDKTITVVRNDASVLPLKPAGSRILVTGYGVGTTALVASELTARGTTVTTHQTGTSPSTAARNAGVAAAAAADLVIVLTNKAWSSPAQVAYVKALLAASTPVVVVAVRDPYDINRFTEAQTYVCTYSYSPVSPPALVRVLTGEVAPTGKLPVDIPTAADAAQVLHPYGHGLTY